MVKLGFIVEGETEKVFIESQQFKNFATKHGLEICSPVIDANGGGNLLPDNIKESVLILQNASVDHIIILTDLEREPTVATVKTRLTSEHIQLIFVAVKAFEAWLLADTQALRKWLKNEDVFIESPETTPDMPWECLKALAKELNARGPGSNKRAFAKQMCQHHGFDLSHAADHPACPSAKEFHDELLKLGCV